MTGWTEQTLDDSLLLPKHSNTRRLPRIRCLRNSHGLVTAGGESQCLLLAQKLPVPQHQQNGVQTSPNTHTDINDISTQQMCYIYPQLYDDGCEAVQTSKEPLLQCWHRKHNQPCLEGKVIVQQVGPCPVHQPASIEKGTILTSEGGEDRATVGSFTEKSLAKLSSISKWKPSLGLGSVLGKPSNASP